MKLSEIVNLILGLKWERKIPFEKTFSFDYNGDGYYYINKTRYKVKKVKDDFWIKIDNPILSETSTLNPSNIKISEKATEGVRFLDVEFHAAVPQKTIELALKLSTILFCIFSLMNIKMGFCRTGVFDVYFSRSRVSVGENGRDPECHF